MTSTFQATLRNDLDELTRLQQSLQTFLEGQGARQQSVGEVRLLVEEIVVNTIRHGCDEGRECSLAVSAEVSQGRLKLEFRDDGRAFDPLQAPAPDLDAPLEKRKVGGLGVYLVKELSDRIEYARRGKWNVLIVERSL